MALKQTKIAIRRFAVLLRRLVLRVYVLEGEREGQPLRVLLADDGSTLDEIRSVFFPDGSRIEPKGSVSALAAPRLINSDADLVVVGANYLLGDLYRRHGFHLAPKYVRQRLPVLETPELTVSRLPTGVQKDIRHKLRRMESMGVTCEEVHDSAWVDMFYDEMYKPYTEDRFGELAAVSGISDVRNAFQRGGALALKQDGVWFSASIVFRQGDVMRFPYSGTRPGYEHLAGRGAKSLLYYRAIGLAGSWGCNCIDLGHTGPFLSDGVLKFKTKWGAEVLDDDDGTGYYAIAAPGTIEAAQDIFTNNSFYESTPEGLTVWSLATSH